MHVCEERLAEKLWNMAKFSIREPCKVTPVCSPCAKRPRLFGLSYEEGDGEGGVVVVVVGDRKREQQIERDTDKES